MKRMAEKEHGVCCGNAPNHVDGVFLFIEADVFTDNLTYGECTP